MGCINDKPIKSNKIRKQQFQNKYHHSANPIIQIAKEWNVDIIKERWHDNQLDVVRAKLGPKTDKITKEQFLKLIPALNNFSQTSQDNFYDLFNFEENPVLSVNNFVTSQIIILKSDDYDLLADMFFFAYSSAPNKTHLNTKDYNSFIKQFKQHQLQFMHQTIKPSKDQNGQIQINKQLFRQIFQQYDIKTIKNLFKFNLKYQERKLQKYLSTYAIDRCNNAQVFMIDFQWFLKWKNYMEYKYGIKIDVKENGKQLDKEKNNFMLSTFKTNEKWLKAGEKLASQSEESYMEPVNNDRIQGDEVNELKQGLLEFSDFISIPVDIWTQIRIIYGGGPSIDKPFPHFYNKRITLVIFDQNKCDFIPGFWKALVYDPNETFEQIYKKRQQRYFMKESFDDMVVYYKHPGELEWKKIANLDQKLQNFPFQYKSYVVFVKNDMTKKFQEKFNLTEVKGKKQIKQRIKNYGNLLNFQHQAILQQGYVGGIFANTVLLYLKSSKGQYLKIQSKFSDLQKLNPNILQQNFIQGFAGLQNIGNTCYINAPLQCLLKTPYFDEYMDSVNLDRGRKDMLTYQLQDIHEKSRNSRDCISMSNFKKRFDEKFPFFQGTAQHDAQQFLLLLLDKLSQQQPRESLIGPQIKKNKKIHTFFSGLTRSQTQCLSCHNKGHTEQPFFTYSLSLPIIKQTLFKFYYIDEQFRVKKYGLTILRECELGEVVRKIENQLNVEELMMVSVCEGEWMNDVNKMSPAYKISKLENYDSAIVCYPVKYKTTPDYEDLVEGKTKNSIKLQVRNRVFDQKKKVYKPFHFPFCVEVNHQTTGKSLTFSIIDKIKKFINDQEYHVFKEFEQQLEDEYIKLLGTTTTNRDHQKPSENNRDQGKQVQNPLGKTKTSRQKIKDLPFTIQYLRKQDGMRSTCWFCKKNIDHSGKKIDDQTDCRGCEFKDTERLYESRAFMKGFNSLVISIDWKSKLFSKDWTIEQTKSYQQALKQQNDRKSQLTNLLKQAANQQQSIELKCQKPTCQSRQALRKQFIIEAPNILILHLKRFYYKDNTFHKLKNKVVIPQQFELPGFSDKYELYGNVVHYGSGTGRGGHYVNYVKVSGRWYRCDDQKVHFTKDPNEHLNPDAYLLFYKRQKIDKSWSFFGF